MTKTIKSAADVAVAIVDQTVHRHDMIEPAQRICQHVARREGHPSGQPRRQTLARDLDQRGRDVHSQNIRATRHQLCGHLPGTTTGIKDPCAAQILGQLRQHLGPHPVAPTPHRLADPRDRRIRGQPLPGAGRSLVEIGLDTRQGAIIGHQSNPSSSKISRSGSGAGANVAVEL